jgi:hypothetical protein
MSEKPSIEELNAMEPEERRKALIQAEKQLPMSKVLDAYNEEKNRGVEDYESEIRDSGEANNG